MFSKLSSILREVFTEEGGSVASNENRYQRAMAGLLCEVADADNELDPREEAAKTRLLAALLNIDETAASALVNDAKVDSSNSVSLYDYTDKLRQLEQPQRFDLIKAMWGVAYADGKLDPLEDSVIRKTAELLYLDHAMFIKAKLEAQADSNF
ncbi:TerB family tellurite resistance protein [Enterovibrio makurazakiensis]|uniref:TerB family tellurite resistance protein n=1 Tax=Enterovibrio gelatinilyticus TaxID=2899819 RepID=A0ABT5QVB1_9GAMM|nr:TerB family tellurite resistance protein [Enterovibrio sp. ZSDZ42]MDD1791560.1 TerB family tellurite resistance protein [Enterovibrio sp. ZSDZ42]